MAKTAEDTAERDELAFRLYAERTAKMPAAANGAELTRWAFRKAEDFLSMRDKIRNGTEQPAVDSKLAGVCAPNLKPTHPHNLVSQRFASSHGGEPAVLNRIRQIAEWLDKHPKNEKSPVKYEPLDWDVETTDLAREILPEYVSN